MIVALELDDLAPAGEADDAAFMRRAYLDTIGTMPTAAEARAFLADKGALKRDRLIDSILARPEYAEYQAMVEAADRDPEGFWPRCCGDGCEPCNADLCRIAARALVLMGTPRSSPLP